MNTAERVLALLTENPGYVSGQNIANSLKISRTAVWKAVNVLKARGLHIEGKTRLGYHLLPDERKNDHDLHAG